MTQYKVLGTGQKPVEIDGTQYQTGDVVELSAEVADAALAASKVEVISEEGVEVAPAAEAPAEEAPAAETTDSEDDDDSDGEDEDEDEGGEDEDEKKEPETI